jgi:SHS2 domain-containing protein
MTASSRTLQHVGEWKVELRASSLEELFSELARTLAGVAGTTSATGAARAWEQVELEARDYATLLVDWANELIGRGEVAGRAYAGVRHLVIQASPKAFVRLAAEVRGEPIDEWRSPVKAATYHDALVARDAAGWHAIVLLDV